MHRAFIILSLTFSAVGAHHAHAQEAVDLSGDRESYFSSILLERTHPEIPDVPGTGFVSLSAEDLVAMRASGIDPSWIETRFDIPVFNPSLRRFTQEDHPIAVESWATHHSSKSGMALNDSLRFKVGRTTDLSDGNIAGSNGALNSDGDEHIASITQSEGEYDIYDLSLQWDAFEAGDVKLSLMSGVKAIEANIAKRVSDASGNTSIDSAHRVTALPMIGSGVSWQITDDFSIRGSALTHPIESGNALMDFNAATNLRITGNVGFVAGYRIIRSSFEVDSIDTELTQEGLFARLQISF
ncbi:MAG: hypothetical protein ACF8MF_08970 [Phycisphaerales bacterium JB052]